MASPLLVSHEATGLAVQISVDGPDDFNANYTLPAGDALVVGSNPACGLRIEGNGVAGMHCTLSLEKGDLVVDDWDTGPGTYVNGKRVARQIVVPPNAELVIGSFRITTRLAEPASESAGEADESSQVDEAIAKDLPRPEESREEDLNATDIWDSPLGDFDLRNERKESPQSGYSHADFDDETEELLKVELEFLRAEVAERDARLAEFEDGSMKPLIPVDEDLPTRDEVETLVSRLEDLLAELELSDERLKMMTELLRTSEEANVAAEEERSQMETWIGEVERRVRQWESEWHAERDNLNKQIAELTTQRDAAEKLGIDSEQIDLIHQLRSEGAKLKSQLAQTHTERDELQRRLETSEVQSVEQRVADAVEQALREERLQISQLKAECARERSNLAKQQDELLSRQSLLTAEPNEADLRIRAFREHLKEVRASEPGRPAPSMSQRLGKIWRKIEGRPLDTD